MRHAIELELEQTKKALIITQIIGAPAMILIGLAVYGLYGADGDAFHPFLNNADNCYFMIAIGSIIAVWEMRRTLMLSKKQQALTEQLEDKP